MNLITGNPWRLVNGVYTDFDRLLNGHGHDATTVRKANSHWQPAVDIREEKTRYVIELDVPGVKNEDINVSMEDGVLVIEGERRSIEAEEDSKATRRERATGRFRREFTLPDQADSSAISAKNRDGVLEVVINKHEEQLPRRIEIS